MYIVAKEWKYYKLKCDYSNLQAEMIRRFWAIVDNAYASKETFGAGAIKAFLSELLLCSIGDWTVETICLDTMTQSLIDKLTYEKEVPQGTVSHMM